MNYNFDPKKSLIHTRMFPYAKEKVWQAWVDPKILTLWWGPEGFTSTFHEFDFQPGGYWRFVLHSPAETDYENECRFIEIQEKEKIVFEHLSGHFFTITALLKEIEGQTKLTWIMGFETTEECEKMKPFVETPNEQNLDRLGEVLKKKYNEPCTTTPLPKIGSPATQALLSIGIASLEEVAAYSEKELLDLHGVGPKAIRILKDVMKEKGMSFKK